METRSLRFRLVCLAALFGLAATASAQVVFTITATANDNNLGYVMGNSYTFVLTTGSSFADNSSSVFLPTRNLWQEEYTADDQLWSSIGGSGLGGSFVRPTIDAGSPSSILKVNAPNELLFAATANTFGENIGLTAPNTYIVGGFEFSILPDTVTFAFANMHTQPNTYFAGYNGTFTPVSPGWGRIFMPTVYSGSQAEFTFTSLTISGGAVVPEPSTSAVILGALGLGFAAWRRHRAG